jgi:hypothetical protein
MGLKSIETISLNAALILPDEPGVTDGQTVEQIHENHHHQEYEAEQQKVYFYCIKFEQEADTRR